MADKLTNINAAIAEILEDDHVTAEGAGYRVAPDGGSELLIWPVRNRGGWAAYFGSSHPDDLRPQGGLPGSWSPDAQGAVLFALRG